MMRSQTFFETVNFVRDALFEDAEPSSGEGRFPTDFYKTIFIV